MFILSSKGEGQPPEPLNMISGSVRHWAVPTGEYLLVIIDRYLTTFNREKRLVLAADIGCDHLVVTKHLTSH